MTYRIHWIVAGAMTLVMYAAMPFKNLDPNKEIAKVNSTTSKILNTGKKKTAQQKVVERVFPLNKRK